MENARSGHTATLIAVRWPAAWMKPSPTSDANRFADVYSIADADSIADASSIDADGCERRESDARLDPRGDAGAVTKSGNPLATKIVLWSVGGAIAIAVESCWCRESAARSFDLDNQAGGLGYRSHQGIRASKYE